MKIKIKNNFVSFKLGTKGPQHCPLWIEMKMERKWFKIAQWHQWFTFSYPADRIYENKIFLCQDLINVCRKNHIDTEYSALNKRKRFWSRDWGQSNLNLILQDIYPYRCESWSYIRNGYLEKLVCFGFFAYWMSNFFSSKH